MKKQITILVADDNTDDRISLRDLLESKGYEVLEASDTNETFAEVRRNLPDLVLLDVEMPPEDGYAVCRRIRQDPHTRNVPILMLTCHGFTQERVAGMRAGADDYLVKPCDNEELLERIEAIFRRIPPKARFFARLEDASRSIKAVESFRQFVVVMNIDLAGSLKVHAKVNEEYDRALVFRDYHCLVDDVVARYEGTPTDWAGDGGTTEFKQAKHAVSAGLEILDSCFRQPRLAGLSLRIGIAGGDELIDPHGRIGTRTSKTHDRAGHFQKHSNLNKVTIGKEILEAVEDPARFCKRKRIDGERVYEGQA